MTSVEKRRSGRKSGGHRKHSDGGYSDTSSGGSFLDETDREVSNLTDRAFRSLCIGDEAVYNDSDLCSSSPCSQRDRQRAFSQGGQDRVAGERGELKRAAHESLSLRVQQYGQDWIHEGMYGTKIQRDPQWEVYGERTQGRVSATFQHSFVETSQQQESLKGEQMSILTNGATELNSRHHRSRSRVSSLIRAFNSEGHREGTETEGNLRECNNDTSWDKSALMSIQRELYEFSTSYQQNLNSGYFPSTGMYSSTDTNFYSPEVAAVAHINSEASFIRSPHSKHTMSAQVNCASNFFIHSEFSPFKVWRNPNRFPFQQGHVPGFMHCSEFPKFYETPMYKNISLEAQPQGPHMIEETGIRHSRNNLEPVVPHTPSRSTSTSTVLQKALAVEKRCESELAGQYPHRKQVLSLGTNRIPSNRPSTASPTIEMSRRVQDTISSVKALQQKIKMMTEKNIPPGMTMTQHGELCGTDKLIPFDNNVKTVASTNTSKTPFSISQLLTPSVYAHQEVEPSKVQVSPLLMEHPPVRAESRGATLDVKMSSYKSRATSLLFNLKDNRKRVKSTYSPTKFKGLETQEKNKQQSCRESRDFVIDIPDFSDPEMNYPQEEESSHMKAASNQCASQYHNPGPSLTTLNSQPAASHTGQYSQYSSMNHQPAQMQSEMIHHSGFTVPENYTTPHLADGQNLQHHLLSPYKEGLIEKTETLGDDCRLKPNYYTPSEMPRLKANNNQTIEYLKYRENNQQHAMDTVERDFKKVLNNNSYYSNESLQDRWRQTSNEDTEDLSPVTAIAPSKQEMSALMDKERAVAIKDKQTLPRDKYRGEENQQYTNKELEKMEQKENFSTGTSHKNAEFVNSNVPFAISMVENAGNYGQQQHEVCQGKHLNSNSYAQNKENEKKDNYSGQDYNRETSHGHSNRESLHSNKDASLTTQETVQKNLNSKGHGMQIFQPKEFENIVQKDSLSRPGDAFDPTTASRLEHGQTVEVKAGHLKAQNNHAELGKIPHFVGQSKLESGRIILAGQSGEKVKTELTDRTEESREKVWSREEETKTEQAREQKVTEEPHIITEEIRAKHTGQFQGEVEKLKEERIQTELPKTEQARIQQTKMEDVRGEKIEAEQLKEEQVGGEVERKQMEAEQIRADNVTAEQSKAETDKLMETKEQKMESEQGKEVEDELVQECQIKADQITTLMNKAKEEEPKVELAKAEDTETEKMKEKLAKPATKPSESQPVRGEPDKVERVKTELAKAKAELAKIKEKMRGEQKDKVRNPFLSNDDGIKKDFPFSVNVDKNEESKDQEQETQMHQQREEPVFVSRQNTYQVIRGADDYERLREKYGLTETTATNRNKLSATGNSASNDNNEMPTLSSDKVETMNNTQSKDKYCPANRLTSAHAENKEVVDGFEPNEVTETHYVNSDCSRDSKLSSSGYLHRNTDRANSNPAIDKVKDDSVEKLEKFEPLKFSDVSQQRESNLAKSLPTERKPKSTEHSGGQGNEPGFTPNRTLSHKERAQTKQEILTSKIKAHAQKEISLIKERGFAMSKTSTKQSSGGQNMNIQQRPPLQEVSKNHERTISSNSTIKHQMEPPGTQTEPIMSVSPPSSATVPVKHATTSSYIVDHKQKHLPREPMKGHNNMPGAPLEAKQTASSTMSTEGCTEDPRKENHTEIVSLLQSMEEAPINQGKQEENKGQISGDQKKRLPVINADCLSKKGEDSPHAATPLVEAENSRRLLIEKTESKHTAVYEDSEPPPDIVLCQAEPSVADDSLQIMGIMVTVQERKPLVSSEQEINDSSQKQVASKESSDLEFDKSHPCSGLEESKGNISSNDVRKHKLNTVAQNTHPTVKEAQTEVDESHPPKSVHESTALETRQNNVSMRVTKEKTTYQQEGPCNEHFANTRPQRETKHKDPPAKRAASSTDSVPAGASTETQQFAYKHERIAQKEHTNQNTKENSGKTRGKDAAKNNNDEQNTHIRQMADTTEKFIGEIVSAGPYHINDSNREQAERLMKYDAQPSVKEDMIMVINPLKSRSTDGKSLLLQDKRRHDSTSPGPCNKISPSKHLTENENTHISPKYQCKETQNVENNQMDTNVHIGSIAIRVVSGINDKDNLEMVRKQVPSNEATVNEHKLLAMSSENTSHSEDRTKDLPPASSEKHKDTVEYKSEVQHVLSSVTKLSDSLKISNQQNTISEKTQAEHGKDSSMDESKMQPSESDYFQVQGVVDTNKSQNRANVVDPSDAPLQVRKDPGLVSNKAAINSESYDESRNKTAMDQSKMKTVESCSVSVQDESRHRKNREIEDHLADRQSRKNEKRETSQVTSNSKQHKENQSSMSAKEKHISRNPYQTKENLVKEKPEVKAKPKERASTIPEISAIADYARLKVIVSEEPENPIQEFPPSKKEGFFPLIQSRHSRRPVFTVDPPHIPVRGKGFPNKTEMSPKVNKEPKPLVFPITDKEHQRTGMFKLGDKERHEKMLFNGKSAGNVLDIAGTKHAQHLKDRNKFLTNHLKNHGSEKHVAGTNSHTDHQSNIPPLQATSSLAVNSPRNTNVSQHLNSSGESKPHGKPEECSLKAERTLYSPSKFTEEQQQTTVKNNEKIKDKLAKTEKERPDKQRQEMPEAQHEETTANPSRIKQMEKDLISRIERGERVEDKKIIHMIEESRASLAEEERRAAQREEERRAREREAIALEIRERREKQRKAERRAEEERRAKQTEGENAAEKEKMMRAKQEVRRIEDSEEKRRIKIEEERREKLSDEETNALKEEQQRRSTREEQRMRAAQDEQQGRAAQVEQHRRAAVIEEQRRRAALEETQQRAAQEGQQRRAALIEEKQRRAALEETQRRAALVEEQRRAALVEEQSGAKQTEEKISVYSEQEKKGKPKDAVKEAQRDKPKREELLISQREEEEMGVVEKEKTIIKHREKMTRHPKVEVESSVAKEHMLPRAEDEIRAKRREEEKLASDREKERNLQIEKQKRAAQRLEALQYYAITSTEPDRKPREKQTCSPSPSQQRNNLSGPESPEDPHTRPHRPHAPVSPAPSLPRSNTSSPALGTKPSMFRVKDNTIRGSSLTRSVKPRFHKNFAEDFRVGSPMGSERGEDEQEAVRHSAMPPLHPDTGSNRLAAIRESVTSSSQDYSAPLSHPRPYTRRSIALDEDDCRSVFSNMSEDVESFATSAADLADVRGLYDYERPESACSFSSDVSRTLGKPPVVPPKSDKALRRAQRLTTRRIKKELSKAVADNPSLQEVSNKPSSSSSEVRSFSRHAVTSPHFYPPVSLAHAPAVESNLPACHTESPSSHSAFYASPHATGPVCLPAASPHAAAPVSLPVASPHAAGLAYHPAAPETIADVPSSPTLHHANHPAPVTQYHVESSYPQSYPLTQRKVLQDLGSGQYFVVDVPVQVKMKTFFDPETGKYVQLNVRESAKRTSRAQPQLPPQVHLKPQQQPLSQDPPAGKPLFHCYPQNHQPVDINSMPHIRSSAPVTLHQDQQPVLESHSSKYPATETVHSSKGHHYSPEKTPYMDTVTDTDKICNSVYNTDGPHDSLRECDTNSHFAGSSVCENCSLAHSRYHPRDIITMGELEDFMELSDW